MFHSRSEQAALAEDEARRTLVRRRDIALGKLRSIQCVTISGKPYIGLALKRTEGDDAARLRRVLMLPTNRTLQKGQLTREDLNALWDSGMIPADEPLMVIRIRWEEGRELPG